MVQAFKCGTLSDFTARFAHCAEFGESRIFFLVDRTEERE
jgi:hypothetical protein